MSKLLKSKSLLVIVSIIGSTLFFSCQKDDISNSTANELQVSATSKNAEVNEIVYSLKAPDGRYLSSENGFKPVSATRISVGAWEKLTFEEMPGRLTVVRGNNNKYLAEGNDGALAFTASREQAIQFFTSFSGLFPEFRFRGYKLSDNGSRLEASSEDSTFFTLEVIN